jgi:hypothetical protein
MSVVGQSVRFRGLRGLPRAVAGWTFPTPAPMGMGGLLRRNCRPVSESAQRSAVLEAPKSHPGLSPRGPSRGRATCGEEGERARDVQEWLKEMKSTHAAAAHPWNLDHLGSARAMACPGRRQTLRQWPQAADSGPRHRQFSVEEDRCHWDGRRLRTDERYFQTRPTGAARDAYFFVLLSPATKTKEWAARSLHHPFTAQD